MKKLTARHALDNYFLEARCRLLDLAAILDRIERGDGHAELLHDPRLERIQQGIEILKDSATNRAEKIQKIFSLEYDPTWPKPEPR